MYRYLIITLQILIICVPSVFARTAAVWYASDEMYVTAMHYIEAERAAGSTICLSDSPLETGKVDVLYVIGHGWREGSSGGVMVYVDGIERRLPFKVLLNTAKRVGTGCVIVDSCYSGFAVDAAANNGIGISVIAGCARNELMPVSSEGSLFSVMWSPGEALENEYSVEGHVIHPKKRLI